MEYCLRIVGAGEKNIAAFLIAALKSDNTDNKVKLKGKERLSNMLKSGKELKIFAIQNSDLEQFGKEAKRYGVVYCALKDKGGSPDSLVDIMAKAEDASKISRIMERLQFATIDRATVEKQMAEHDRDAPDVGDTDKLLDMLIDADGKAIKDEPNVEVEQPQNPTTARAAAENRQSASRYRTPPESAEVTPGTRKPESVKQFLRERMAQNLKKQNERNAERAQPEAKQQQRTPPLHQQPQYRRKNKSKKSKERA
jgi:hypothetical protein